MLSAWLCLALAAAPASAANGRDLEKAASDPLLQDALRALYQLDYVETRDKTRQFIQKDPDNPLGHLFMTGVLWWQAATEHGLLAEQPGLAESFDEQVERTEEKAESLLKDKDDDRKADGLFTAGMVLGLRGQMKLTEGNLFAAYRDGKKAMKYLKKCVKLKPDYYDAYMGLGIFDYQVAVMPGVLRFGAKLLLRGTGNAERGLRQVRLAIDKGRFASRQAASFLLTLYILYDRDYEKGLALTQELLRAFPDSPYYRFVELALLNRKGEWELSHGRARELFDSLAKDPATLRRKQRGTVCGLMGAQCLDREHLVGAERWLSRALASADAAREAPAAPSPPEPAGWRPLLHLYRGLARDALERRREALRDFDAALELPDFAGSHAWARRCRDQACGQGEIWRVLRGDDPPDGRAIAR